MKEKDQNYVVYCNETSRYINTAQTFEECIVGQSCYGENPCPHMEEFIPMTNLSKDNLKYLLARIAKQS